MRNQNSFRTNIRKYNFLILVLITLSCNKKSDNATSTSSAVPHVGPYYGNVIAFQNGLSWKADITANKDSASGLYDRFSISFDRYGQYDANGDSVIRERFVLGNLQFMAYMSSLDYFVISKDPQHPAANRSEFCVYTKYYEDGDVISPPHHIDTTQPHYVEITSYNPTTHEVWGKFDVTFISYGNTDTTRFNNGSFYTKIF